MKKPLLNSKQIFGLIAVSAFLAPLVIMVILVINDLTKEKLPYNSETLVLLTVK